MSNDKLEVSHGSTSGYSDSAANVGNRFDSVDHALLEQTSRLARNTRDLEFLAGRLFGYVLPETQAPEEDSDDAPAPLRVKPSFVESANGHAEYLVAFNQRIENVIKAFNS